MTLSRHAPWSLPTRFGSAAKARKTTIDTGRTAASLGNPNTAGLKISDDESGGMLNLCVALLGVVVQGALPCSPVCGWLVDSEPMSALILSVSFIGIVIVLHIIAKFRG